MTRTAVGLALRETAVPEVQAGGCVALSYRNKYSVIEFERLHEVAFLVTGVALVN